MLKKFRNSMLWRRLKILGAIAIVVCVTLAGFVWFQEAPLRKAGALLDEGQSTAALELIVTWEKQHFPTGRSLALRARCYVEDGRYSEAVQIFESVGPETSAEIHAWASAHLSLQQWAEALPLLKDLRSRDPGNADVLHELAACQTKLGLYDEALVTAHEFALHPEFAHRAWLLIGAIERERGNQEKTLEAWNHIAQYDPDYSDLQLPADEFLTQFAGLQLELGNVPEAVKLITRALAIRGTAEAHYQAGLAADLQGKTAEAKQHWTRALELDPYHLLARESLARAAITEGDGAEAEAVLRPILQSNSLKSSTTYLMQRAAIQRGDEQQAQQWQEETEKLRKRELIDEAAIQILRENPNSYWARVIRAYQFAELGNPDQAKQLLDTLEVTDKEDPFVLELKEAVRTNGTLPAKDRLPIKLF